MNAPLMVVVVSFALCQCCATWHFFGKPASGPEQNQASLRLGVECRVRLFGGDGWGFVAGADTAFRKRNQSEAFTIPPGQFAFLLTKEVVSVPADALAFISIRVKTKFRGLVNVSGWHDLTLPSWAMGAPRTGAGHVLDLAAMLGSLAVAGLLTLRIEWGARFNAWVSWIGLVVGGGLSYFGLSLASRS
jgi:hypothetical protein